MFLRHNTVHVLVAIATAFTMANAPIAAREPTSPTAPTASPTATIEKMALPKEAQATLVLIRSGGPFPYAKDGTVFGNREGILAHQPRGYYREYTVKTPGSRNRGARRIVCGGLPPPKATECYYTDDHYASFKRIKE